MRPYLNLGFDSLSPKNESILERDSPKLTFRFEPEDITFNEVKNAGRLLDRNRCISLIFLLVGNNKIAYDLCKQVRILEEIQL